MGLRGTQEDCAFPNRHGGRALPRNEHDWLGSAVGFTLIELLVVITIIGILGSMEDQPQSRRKAGLAVWTLWSLPLARRVTASCFFILVLLLLRQWYIGGRIPLLREPAKLVIDPASAESSRVP